VVFLTKPPALSRHGYALAVAQEGGKHPDAKPLRGFGGAGVLEVVEGFDGDTYRAVYTVRFEGDLRSPCLAEKVEIRNRELDERKRHWAASGVFYRPNDKIGFSDIRKMLSLRESLIKERSHFGPVLALDEVLNTLCDSVMSVKHFLDPVFALRQRARRHAKILRHVFVKNNLVRNSGSQL